MKEVYVLTSCRSILGLYTSHEAAFEAAKKYMLKYHPGSPINIRTLGATDTTYITVTYKRMGPDLETFGDYTEALTIKPYKVEE